MLDKDRFQSNLYARTNTLSKLVDFLLNKTYQRTIGPSYSEQLSSEDGEGSRSSKPFSLQVSWKIFAH